MDQSTMMVTMLTWGVFDGETRTDPLTANDLVGLLALVSVGATAFGIYKLVDWLDL